MNSSRSRRVIVMNDTSQRGHHGCSRVMRVLCANLEARGLEIVARSPARHDWEADATFLGLLKSADLVVINGEGTLHHGRPAGERLLRVVNAVAPRTRVALINALYQANPPEWSRYLGKLALVSARESASAEALTRAKAPSVRVVPDLSLCEGFDTGEAPRDLLLFGDSVRWNLRRDLARAAKRVGADVFLPTKRLRSPALQKLFRLPVARDLLFATYNATWPATRPRLVLADDEAAYLAWLHRARAHVTGRFHAVCLSLVTRTPFVAVGSNSWKTEAMLQDAGLGTSRLVSPSELSDLSNNNMKLPFSDEELQNIDTFLQDARSTASRLFDDLAALAGESRA